MAATGVGVGVEGEAELVDPLVGRAGHDRLAGRVTGGMVIVAPLRVGLGVATRPDADVDRVDQLPVDERLARDEVVQRLARHAAIREGGVRAA